jgi:Fe-Mn family superoxide dismutase
MPIKLIPLPYSAEALEPAISAETLNFHHGKHHRAYVEKTSELVADTGLADEPLESIIAAASKQGDAKLFNQAAQVWNHGFYWHSLTPEKTSPSQALATAINSSFGSHEQMIEKLLEEAAARFASGWAWLVANQGQLAITTTGNADRPSEGGTPLLVIDVWEHAYYIDRRNDRQAYLEAAASVLDWQFASENLERDAWWTYPDEV